jgi:single-strand DNA-binding protein
MGDVNKQILVGNLGADPELRHSLDGTPVCNLRVATNEYFTKDGEKQKVTTWHSVSVWGKQAESCAKYLAKGRKVYVEGQTRTREYTDKEGVKQTRTEIRAQEVTFLDRNPDQPNDKGD